MPDLGKIAQLLEDEKVTDILIDGNHAALVDRGKTLESIANPFELEGEVDAWARKIIAEGGSRLDLAKPIAVVSIRSEFGLLRVHCVLGGECSSRTQISIRRHSQNQITFAHLLHSNALTAEEHQLLTGILSRRENFVIVGSTGSGKTTLLKAMLNHVSTERVITIEDSAELMLGGNSVELVTRAANHEGAGEITLGQLVREALRMRPDRLVIGEARGEELLVLLQALNTGHGGSGFTLHANSHSETISRMLAILAGVGVLPELGKLLIDSSLKWVIEVRKLNSERKIVAIRKLGIESV